MYFSLSLVFCLCEIKGVGLVRSSQRRASERPLALLGPQCMQASTCALHQPTNGSSRWSVLFDILSSASQVPAPPFPASLNSKTPGKLMLTGEISGLHLKDLRSRWV